MLRKLSASQEFENGNFSEQICLEVVRENGIKLAHIPTEKRTFVICIAAVKQTGQALVHVHMFRGSEERWISIN
jgi:hypothetical protein